MDEFLPVYDFSEKHEIVIATTPKKGYEALQEMNFSQSFLISLLLRLRGLKGGSYQNLQEHFIILSESPPSEIVLGLVARPWTPKGGLMKISKEEFLSFNVPGYAKMTWNFTFQQVSEGTRVTTETRIFCTDKASKIKFSIYWFFVRPFSGLIRREMLRILKIHCEGRV